MDMIQSWILNRDNNYAHDCEELSQLELLGKIGNKTNEVVEYSNKLNKKVDDNERDIEEKFLGLDNKKVSHEQMNNMYKMDKYANFTGTWQGLDRPTLSEEGMRATVEKLNVKLIGYNSVKEYGAKGDGSTDDTIAIQKCIDTVKNGMIYFPKGNYKISGTLIFSNHGTKLVGECPQSTYIQMVGNGIPCIKFYNSTVTMSGCIIQDISLYYSGSTTSTNYGIDFNTQVNAKISNVIIQDFKTGLHCNHVGNTHVEHVGVVSSVSGAIGIQSGGKSVSTYYLNCYVGFSGGAVDNGIGLLCNEGNIADINVEYFDVGNGGYGVVIDGSGAPSEYPPTDINLKNIVVDGVRTSCIQINNINNRGSVNIFGGWFNPLATGNVKCFNIQNSHNISIDGAVMQQLANTKPNIYGVVIGASDNVSVTSCQFLNVLSCASASNSTNVKFDTNVVKVYEDFNSESYCFNLDMCTKNTICNNIVDGEYIKGIVVTGDYSIITNNLIGWSKPSIECASTNKVLANNL